MACDKCAFIFLLLSAFLSPAGVQDIFHYNMLANDTLMLVFMGLVGGAGSKPFDCVGTIAEAKEAVRLSVEMHREHGMELPVVLQALCDYCGCEGEHSGLSVNT